jgi:hypothetical protein
MEKKEEEEKPPAYAGAPPPKYEDVKDKPRKAQWQVLTTDVGYPSILEGTETERYENGQRGWLSVNDTGSSELEKRFKVNPGGLFESRIGSYHEWRICLDKMQIIASRYHMATRRFPGLLEVTHCEEV